MSRFNRLSILALAILVATASTAWAQYIGYVYPAGGQQGNTFTIKIGGQTLLYASGLVVTGEGVSVRVLEHYRTWNNQEMGTLRRQLRELQKKETTVGDVMAAKMAFFEFPAAIEPPEVEGVVCPACGDLNPLGAAICENCNANLPKATAAAPAAKDEAPKSDKEVAKKNLIERIQRIFAEDERTAAVRAHRELVFAEVTVAPDAKPGRREIRVVTKRGISNSLPFYVGQVPEVAHKPMKTTKRQVLGKEHLAQVKRSAEDAEMIVRVPCTMNGQLAAGWVDRYRFKASKGQRLVITANARELIPYVADGVPGWFQAVLRLHDASGNELAYNDDFLFHPDPVLYYEVPEDGTYVLSINEALFRGRESFTYRLTVAESPFVTSIFPLGGRVGEPATIEMDGWNLDKAKIVPPPQDAKPGVHLLAAVNGELTSNHVQFALDTLPECLDAESNDDPATAQKVNLPIIVNGRSDHPGDWDVFEVEGKAGETIVAEVHARRLGSPFDAFVKITNAEGKIIALNDDHYDAASGFNTDHADSYLMAKLPADGKYYVHLGDTRRHAGKTYAYRLRISLPRPDFQLRLASTKMVMRSKASASVKVFAIRKDGYTGPIKLSFKDLPEGFESGGATLPAGKETVGLAVKTTLEETELPVNLTVIGSATVGDREIVNEAVPAEDRMQAFLWRHLQPAETLPALVTNPAWKPDADRVRPEIRDDQRPKGVKRALTSAQVKRPLDQLERLYQAWLLTDEFANREIAKIEARVIQ